MVVPTRRVSTRARRSRPIRCPSIPGSGLTPISSTCSISPRSPRPLGMRGDGLPSSVTLIGPSGADGLLAGSPGGPVASGRADGGDETAPPSPPPAPALSTNRRPHRDHRRRRASLGLPLNRELTELGGSFLREVETSGDYRLFALPGTAPAKPGSAACRRRRGRADQGGGVDARCRGFRRFCRQDSGAARHRQVCASRTEGR